MKSGLLIQDTDKKSLGEKLEAAAQRYFEKYGTVPDRAFVHPSNYDELLTNDVAREAQDDGKLKINTKFYIGQEPVSLNISPKFSVLPNHIWLGVDAT